MFETVLFGLTLAALPGRIRSGNARRSVVDIIVRDGTWAFAMAFGELTTVYRQRPVVWQLTAVLSGTVDNRHPLCSIQLGARLCGLQVRMPADCRGL